MKLHFILVSGMRKEMVSVQSKIYWIVEKIKLATKNT